MEPDAKPFAFNCKQKGSHKFHEIFRDLKKFTAIEIVKCMKEINESRREWILQQFADTGAPLTRITNYKVWQDGNHPVELATNKMITERLFYLHYNPVEAGFVWKPEDYCYGSAFDYAGESCHAEKHTDQMAIYAFLVFFIFLKELLSNQSI